MSFLPLTTAKWPTRLPSNSKCVNRNSVLCEPQSISRPEDRKILFLGSVCMLMCVCVCERIMPHAWGHAECCRDEYNVAVKRKITVIYSGRGSITELAVGRSFVSAGRHRDGGGKHRQ